MPNLLASPDLNRKLLARPVLCVAVGLQVLHVAVVAFMPHASVISNILQLCFPVLAALVSLQHALTSPYRIGFRCWMASASAFAIWAMAQLIFLYFMFHPHVWKGSVRPDDALWALFGLPLLLAVTLSHNERDQVAWLDRCQALLFFAVLYCLVFLPGARLNLIRAYLIENIALLLCCSLRLPLSVTALERRFFLRLALFLLAYSASEFTSEMLYMHGMQMGSFADLLWTLPITYFVVLTQRDSLQIQHEGGRVKKLVQAVGAMQGLSVAVLAFLSIGVAALLATRRPVLGGASVVAAFTLFALRTNARERLWHEMHGHLEETVLRDALTGLGNRLQLRKKLNERLAEAQGEQIVLLFADLDRFKSINDSLGHSVGDRLLVEIGRRLTRAAPSDAVVCRLGGDEFVVLSSATSQAEAQAAGEALLQALHKPFELDAHTVRCTASIGVVLAAEDESANDLLRTADHAMYRAKQLGRDRVQVFDADLRTQLSSRWLMERELRQCVEQGRIQVEFQPIYSVKQDAICGFEALARWTHTTLGMVSPAQFIPLAEETGLILSLGSQVLERACAQMAAWNDTWGTALSVSVNVSPRQFADTSLIPTLLSVLEKTGLPPSLLRLEITETALLTHESVVKHTLEQARQHGIRISLDDFGTGYSSLSFLLSLPVDEVKVDRSFVSHMHMDPDREELVRTVIHLGHSLGKRVVAEGVETEQDLLGLAEMGCECVQGYLISKPLTPAAVESDLSRIAACKRSIPALSSRHSGVPTRLGGAAIERAAQRRSEVPAGA